MEKTFNEINLENNILSQRFILIGIAQKLGELSEKLNDEINRNSEIVVEDYIEIFDNLKEILKDSECRIRYFKEFVEKERNKAKTGE